MKKIALFVFFGIVILLLVSEILSRTKRGKELNQKYKLQEQERQLKKQNQIDDLKYLNIDLIAGKKLDEVSLVLGEYEKIQGNSKYLGYKFRNGEIEVIFINGKADWITYNNVDFIDFANCSIDYFGDYDCVNRNFKSNSVMKWNRLRNIKEISFFRKFGNDGKPLSKLDYVYVKVFTE